jgi:hypothetical protein
MILSQELESYRINKALLPSEAGLY